MKPMDLRRVAQMRSLAASGGARQMREAARVSLREAAEVLDTSSSTLSRCETGECRPRPELALRWARLLADLSGSRI